MPAARNTGGRPKKNPSESEWIESRKEFSDLRDRVKELEDQNSEKRFIDQMIASQAAMNGARLPKESQVMDYVALALRIRRQAHALLGTFDEATV
jgi:hypothetical protein